MSICICMYLQVVHSNGRSLFNDRLETKCHYFLGCDRYKREYYLLNAQRYNTIFAMNSKMDILNMEPVILVKSRHLTLPWA